MSSRKDITKLRFLFLMLVQNSNLILSVSCHQSSGSCSLGNARDSFVLHWMASNTSRIGGKFSNCSSRLGFLVVEFCTTCKEVRKESIRYPTFRNCRSVPREVPVPSRTTKTRGRDISWNGSVETFSGREGIGKEMVLWILGTKISRMSHHFPGFANPLHGPFVRHAERMSLPGSFSFQKAIHIHEQSISSFDS